MYAYNCDDILTNVMKKRSDKDIIQDFTELTADFKISGINLGFDFIDKKASTPLKCQ